MKIAILNESFLAEEHLEKLKTFGEVVIYSDTNSEEKAIERLKDIDVAIVDCFICPLNRKVFDSVNALKFVSLNSTGFNPVDLAAAKSKGIKLSNVPEFATESVAEQALALLFAVNRRIILGNEEMHKEPFETDPGNSEHIRKYLGFNLHGKTLGIVGLGKIGTQMAKLGQSLEMKVIAWNRTPKEVDGVETMSLQDVLKNSDVVSIHLALSPETEGIISEKELNLLKPAAILINTARGKHIDENALYKALKNKKFQGAGLDVIAAWGKNNPLLELENVVLTPHSGWLTKESLENLPNIILENIEAYIKGKPINIINP